MTEPGQMAEAKRSARLATRTVNTAVPESERFVVWDTDLAGFGLRVEPSGVKTFFVRYRLGGGRRGRQKQVNVGRFGKLTAEQARTKAKELFAKAELGNDPQGDKAAGRKMLTVAELCDRYFEEGATTKKASTLKLDRIRVARHIKPLIGSRRIRDISPGDVERMMADIASGKVKNVATPHTRGGQGAASRTVGLLSAIYGFAIHNRMTTENPTKGVKRFKDRKRERHLSADEMGRLGETLAEMDALGANPHFSNIVRLLMLTSARKNEIARLRWCEVDLERHLIILEESKVGRRAIHLGDPAVDLLAALDRGDSEYVFPDAKYVGEPVRNFDWAWHNIRTRAGMADLRPHDLRHTFASTGLLGGYPLAALQRLLGHQHASSTEQYAHFAQGALLFPT
jgi:integrase